MNLRDSKFAKELFDGIKNVSNKIAFTVIHQNPTRKAHSNGGDIKVGNEMGATCS